MKNNKLLMIIELGGYPNFAPLYESLGYEVEQATSMRKALGLLKKNDYGVVVCEFNFQSDFRDRTSSLESMMAVLQSRPETRIVVFYEKEFEHQFERVRSRFPIHAALSFPIDEAQLAASLETI
jgi:CheY-like chemotaxis protein